MSGPRSSRCCGQLDFLGGELAEADFAIAKEAVGDPAVRRLMTIPGIDVIVAISIIAAVGDFARFESADKLVAYPRNASQDSSVRQLASDP